MKVLAAAMGLYLLVALLIHVGADLVLFQPDYGSRAAPPGGFGIVDERGVSLSAIYLPNPAARTTIWYFHGNAEDLGDVYGRLVELRDHGFAVFAVDYPGYGISAGKPSEHGVYAANRAGWSWLKRRLELDHHRVIFYGRSVGSGAATQAAVDYPGAGLVLESAFTSAYRVMLKWPLLPWDRFTNLRKLPKVVCPVLVIHGRDDRVIPFEHGERLYAEARGKKRFLWVDRAGHNDLLRWAGQSYWRALADFAAVGGETRRTPAE